MALLSLIVDLANLTCHLVIPVRERTNLDVIGGRPLLVGFDSSLQLFSTSLKLPSKLHILRVSCPVALLDETNRYQPSHLCRIYLTTSSSSYVSYVKCLWNSALMSADMIWICTRRVSMNPLMEHAVWSMRIVCFFNVAGFITKELNF